MYVTFVFSLIKMIVFLSRYTVFNRFLSIFVCGAASLFHGRLVHIHVVAPYVIVGSTQELQTYLQAGSKFTVEDVAMLGDCCKTDCDSF